MSKFPNLVSFSQDIPFFHQNEQFRSKYINPRFVWILFALKIRNFWGIPEYSRRIKDNFEIYLKKNQCFLMSKEQTYLNEYYLLQGISKDFVNSTFQIFEHCANLRIEQAGVHSKLKSIWARPPTHTMGYFYKVQSHNLIMQGGVIQKLRWQDKVIMINSYYQNLKQPQTPNDITLNKKDYHRQLSKNLIKFKAYQWDICRVKEH